uniref:AAA+ ATPase domain-containing protein n=1 Tax=Polysiphonia infestans TaxID=2006978 RepID=A0A1Z1ME89_9FLOR|nr:hypothetical protein [Polysiphonia infestans]ARW64388.1 hypothetical protein [Polysiphonia infestans]
MLIADDLDKLLDILPEFIKFPLNSHPNKKMLIEVVMDLGRRPEARFPGGPQYLSIHSISWYDLDFCIKKIPRFSRDNRSGVECTLHRISSIKNRKGNVIGLTFRVGRAIFGTISIIRDLLYAKKSILLLGKPGVGKTTAIREITRVMADEMQKRVVIIDTSNEIAGDGDIPHPAIGRARRMQVSKPELQHQVMIEAVENHMPEVIIIDEIGTELEALAARTIAERGVQLVGTAHGNCLDNLIKNPTLSDLVGGIQSVTLGDDEAKRRGSQKSVLERKTLPAFQVAIEINERNNWVIHEKVDEVVDRILQGSLIFLQRRMLNDNKFICIKAEDFNSLDFIVHSNSSSSGVIKSSFNEESFLSFKHNNNYKILPKSYSYFKTSFDIKDQKISALFMISILYIYGINIQQVKSSIKNLKLSLVLTRDIFKADYILGLKSSVKYSSKIRRVAKLKKIIIYTINTNTLKSVNKALKQISNIKRNIINNWFRLCLHKQDIELDAIIETRYAIEKIVFICRESVVLLPRNENIRNLQVNLIDLYNLNYSTYGKNTSQTLIVYPN